VCCVPSADPTGLIIGTLHPVAVTTTAGLVGMLNGFEGVAGRRPLPKGYTK